MRKEKKVKYIEGDYFLTTSKITHLTLEQADIQPVEKIEATQFARAYLYKVDEELINILNSCSDKYYFVRRN